MKDVCMTKRLLRVHSPKLHLLMISLAVSLAAYAQIAAQAELLLNQALYFGDLYNWSDAAQPFSEAERLFTNAGDRRNALYARLGRLRATMEQYSLPALSEQLATLLEREPLLQSDKQLRLFAFLVKGDVDGELDPQPARHDWESVLALAKELGNQKWANRATGEIGFQDFLEGDFDRAQKRVFGALVSAKATHDAGAQIRYLAAIGTGLVLGKKYEAALGYFEQADQIAEHTPDAGYQFVLQEGRLQAIRHLSSRIAEAQRLAAEMLKEAKERKKYVKEAQILITSARIAEDQNNYDLAIADLQQSIALSQNGNFRRLLGEAQFELSHLYRLRGELKKAKATVEAAVRSTQTSGDLYLLPDRLAMEGELLEDLHRYQEAAQAFERGSVFVDSMVGRVSKLSSKQALLSAADQIYKDYFSLEADHFHDVPKAYSMIEQIRGRISRDLLVTGSATSPQARQLEHEISRLSVALSTAASNAAVQRVRDRIFYLEQARWATSDATTLKAQLNKQIPLSRVQKALQPNEAILEYVLTEPHSYCLRVTRDRAQILPLPDGQRHIEKLVASYRESMGRKRSESPEAKALYTALVAAPLAREDKEHLIIVPDGALHLLPFDALQDSDGRFLIQTHQVTYVPSAGTLYLLRQTEPRMPRAIPSPLLGVGEVPYETTDIAKIAKTRGYGEEPLGNLPASGEEIDAANEAIQGSTDNALLKGNQATESNFKKALTERTVIHLAVHALANPVSSSRSALLLLSDPAAGEDGLLQATEIGQLQTKANVVILSACNTAVGSLEGEEGISNLSRAFLLSGARNVISTFWPIDDTFTLFLMKQFYHHLTERLSFTDALTQAKRDLLTVFKTQATPYAWAGFKLEGAGDTTTLSNSAQPYVAHTNRPK
jgi:CHAT domain-containing protein